MSTERLGMVPFVPPDAKGKEVTVTISLPDGSEIVTTGTFESAEWDTNVEDITVMGNAKREFYVSDRRFTLRLRRLVKMLKRIP